MGRDRDRPEHAPESLQQRAEEAARSEGEPSSRRRISRRSQAKLELLDELELLELSPSSSSSSSPPDELELLDDELLDELDDELELSEELLEDELELSEELLDDEAWELLLEPVGAVGLSVHP